MHFLLSIAKQRVLRPQMSEMSSLAILVIVQHLHLRPFELCQPTSGADSAPNSRLWENRLWSGRSAWSGARLASWLCRTGSSLGEAALCLLLVSAVEHSFPPFAGCSVSPNIKITHGFHRCSDFAIYKSCTWAAGCMTSSYCHVLLRKHMRRSQMYQRRDTRLCDQHHLPTLDGSPLLLSGSTTFCRMS